MLSRKNKKNNAKIKPERKKNAKEKRDNTNENSI